MKSPKGIFLNYPQNGGRGYFFMKDGDDNEMDPPLFTPRQVDFSAIATSGVDMLRPNGDGLYVGLKNAREEDPEDDRGVCKNDLN